MCWLWFNIKKVLVSLAVTWNKEQKSKDRSQDTLVATDFPLQRFISTQKKEVGDEGLSRLLSSRWSSSHSGISPLLTTVPDLSAQLEKVDFKNVTWNQDFPCDLQISGVWRKNYRRPLHQCMMFGVFMISKIYGETRRRYTFDKYETIWANCEVQENLIWSSMWGFCFHLISAGDWIPTLICWLIWF